MYFPKKQCRTISLNTILLKLWIFCCLCNYQMFWIKPMINLEAVVSVMLSKYYCRVGVFQVSIHLWPLFPLLICFHLSHNIILLSLCLMYQPTIVNRKSPTFFFLEEKSQEICRESQNRMGAFLIYFIYFSSFLSIYLTDNNHVVHSACSPSFGKRMCPKPLAVNTKSCSLGNL